MIFGTRLSFVFSLMTLALAFLAIACGTSSNTVTGPSPDRCALSITSSAPSVGAAGGTGRLTITTGRECTWTMTSSAPWITFTSAAGGQGDGTVDYLVAANANADARRARLGTGAQTVEVVQEGLSCQVDLQPSSHNAGAEGGTASFNVTVASACSWMPTASADWIVIANGGTRNGNGAVTFSVSPNTGGVREGAIAIGGQVFTILQAAPACRYQLSAISQTITGAGGPGSVNVTAPSTCNWTAVSNVPWISIVGNASDNGNGTVSFLVQPNTGPARNGTLTIGGQRFTVTQVQAECNYSISPTSQSFGVSGGGGTVALTTTSVCTWNTSDVPRWVSGVPPSGVGSQTINFTVEANTGAARSANIILGGQAFAISQAAGCTYAVAPVNHNVPAGGGPGTVNLTTAADCTWTSSGVPSWVTGVPASGTGPTAVNFTVAANAGPDRSASIVIGGQTFTISQSAGCAYAVNPTSRTVGSTAGSSSVDVVTSGGCGWTTSGVPTWVTGVPASGTGSATISFSYTANPDATPRSASIIIGGQTFTLNQGAAACTYSLNPGSHSASAGSSSTTFEVATTAGCSWTSSGAPAWITLTPSSGTGTTTVTLVIAANPDPTARTANFTVAGQTFRVDQAAAACSFSLNPTSHSAPSGGGPGSFDVVTAGGCTWNSSGVPAWITGVPTSGSGPATINFTVAANPDPAPRTASITIGGQTFTVNQAAAACSFSLNPTSRTLSAAAGSSTVDVVTTAGCTWTATGMPGWITGVPASGSGPTTITFGVEANTGPLRSESFTIAGRTFTVTQASGCAYSVSPGALTFNRNGTPAQDVTVTTGTGCAWTATTADSWIRITNGTGSGNGVFNVRTDDNPGSTTRTGSVTVEGQTVAITQNP